MANEILKDEILKDEQLSFDELANVAGGTHDETYDDMNYLYNHHGILWPQNWDRAVGQLGQMYFDAGVKLDTSERHANKFYDRYTGRPLNHDEAFRRLKNHLRG